MAAVLLTATGASARHKPSATVDVTIFAINDLHGNLLPPNGGISVPRAPGGTDKIAVPAGGVAQMATMLRKLRAGRRNTIFVGAGDLVGASPLLSGLFHDEPTVRALSLMGLEASAVGNHEFDHGVPELLRLQNGGCHPKDTCDAKHPFTGAKWHYLAASTIDTATGKPVFPPYYIKTFDGVPVAFIGLALKGTPNIVMPGATAGYEFRDEADTVNALVPKLRAKGIEAIVVLIHEGGTPSGGYNECPGISGPIVDIVKKLDKAVDVVVSGHTHEAYNCVIDGRLVTSAHRYGTVVTDIDLKLDRRTHDVIFAKADNLIVRDDKYAQDPAEARLVAHYAALAAPIANRVVGKVTAPLTRDTNPAGETALGQMIADADLDSARGAGAQISFMNNGSLRADLSGGADGSVPYSELFTIQPFGNVLVTMTLTGAQIKALLERQWAPDATANVMQVSRGFSYAWDASRPVGDRVLAQSMLLDGKPIAAEGSYRVTVSNFLAAGGENLPVLREGTDRVTGIPNIDAMEAYLRTHTPLAPPVLDRIKRLN